MPHLVTTFPKAWFLYLRSEGVDPNSAPRVSSRVMEEGEDSLSSGNIISHKMPRGGISCSNPFENHWTGGVSGLLQLQNPLESPTPLPPP